MKKWVLLFLCAAAVAANAADVNVWVPGSLTGIFEGKDYSTNNVPDCVLRLACGRNGCASGQIVRYSKAGCEGAVARVSELRRKEGTGVIAPAAVEVRYALPTSGNGTGKFPPGITGAFDALSPAPRTNGYAHPVWITVNVSSNAEAGEYEGAVELSGQKVPLVLTVYDWVIPDPRNFRTWIDMVESPETVAMHYDKPLWSAEHWSLVEKVWDSLGKVGNKTLYIPLICKTHFGNSETMVRWIKGQKDREFTHDFSIAEKYIDIRVAKAGKPSAVILYLYENLLGGSHGKDKQDYERGAPFTLLDPVTGAVSTGEGPCHNNANPGYPGFPADTIGFWRPVVDGMRERLNKRGIGDEAICLGISGDMAPGAEQMKYLKEVFPYAKWCRQGHALVGSLGGMKIGYTTAVYGWGSARNLGADTIVASFDRDNWKLPFQMQLTSCILLPEWASSYSGLRGAGRQNADFWPVLKDQKGQPAYRLINRYPLSNWAQLSLKTDPFLLPGSDGPMMTVRFQCLREALQVSEARKYLESVLADKNAVAKLDGAVVSDLKSAVELRDKAVSQLLGSEINNPRKSAPSMGGRVDAVPDSAMELESIRKLYACAANVCRLLSK